MTRPIERHGGMPAVQHLSDDELLRLLLGEDADALLSRHSLPDLFALHARPPIVQEDRVSYGACRTLAVAKELLARALRQRVCPGDAYADPAHVRDYLRLRLAGLPHEVFRVMLLDAQHHLIDDVELFRGSLTQTAVYPREIVKLTLERNAAAVIFAHNHPSGVAEPSRADEQLTHTLKAALALVDVKVLDHFIVAGNATPVSFAERGLL